MVYVDSLNAIYPTNWKKHKLHDLCTINYGQSPNRILDQDGIYPVVGTSGTTRKGKDYFIDGETVIIGRKGSIDKPNYYNERIWVIDTAFFTSDHKNLDCRWLYYYLDNSRLSRLNESTGVPSLSRATLYNLELLCPPIFEQQKISQILFTWDRAIERVQRLIEANQRQKKGLMQGLLTGRLRFPEFGEPSCNKVIPDDWKLYKLSQVAHIINGGTPSRNIPQYWGGNIPWIAVGDFSEVDRFVSDTKEKITELGFRESSTNLLKTDELIISARGTVGAVAQLTKPMAFNQTSYGLRANAKLALNDFLFYLLRQFNHKITDISHGAIFDTITRDTFDYIELPFPNLHEQRMIADVLGKMDAQIDQLKKQLEKLKQQKKGLMQKLLTGEIRVKVN